MQRFLKRGILIVGLVLSGCSYSGPENKLSPPIPAYPNAPIQTLVIQQSESFKGESTTVFDTADPPETVLGWYQATLIEVGWELSSMSHPANQRSFGDYSGCPSYHVTITATRHGSTTKVEITTWATGCM